MAVKYYYSGGFYNTEINGKNIPSGAVEITESYYKELIQGQSDGQAIVTNDNGYPVLVIPEVPQEYLATQERAWRDGELQRADVELYKVQDADSKAKGTVGAWREYRKTLRMLPEHPLFPSIEARPVAPDA